MQLRTETIPSIILILACVTLLSFAMYWLWPGFRRSWVRHRLSFGVKPRTLKPQAWKPYIFKPWYHDPGTVLAIIALLSAFVIVAILKLHFDL